MNCLKRLKIHTAVDDIDRASWLELSRHSPYTSFFQSSDCYDFYGSLSLFLTPFVYAVSEDEMLSGLVCGYIIANGGIIAKQFNSRAIIPGGILISEDASDEAVSQLLNTVVGELKQRVIYIEIRNFHDYSRFTALFRNNSPFLYRQHLNYQLAISSSETILRNMSESKRRQIKQAEKQGVYWSETNNGEEIFQFYSILARLYKERLKLPLFPINFFVQLAQSPNGRLLVVKHGNQIIGGIACVVDNNKLYEWFVCGDNSLEKNYYPSVMATWAGIEYALQNNLAIFDFMGAGNPNTAYGVREFKSKFGGQLVEHGRFLAVTKPLLYRLGSYIIEKRVRHKN